MRRLLIKHQLEPADVDAVEELLELAAEADGHRAVDEHRWLDMAAGGRASFAGLVASEPGHGHPVGYAQVSRGQAGDGPANWALDLVVDPHHRDHGLAIGTELLGAALALVRGEGGGHVHLWVYRPTDTHDALARALDLRRGRDLLQLRRSLPLGVDGHDAGVTVRPFRPGVDEEAWLTVNNRAFDWHPEQGGWDLATVAAREAEPWFDPAGFLLHEREGRLAGFCWTKVHSDHDPPLGEIYVIAVDPDFQGLGLGRHLTVSGLEWLAGRGLGVAMLYVDAANTAARQLYEDLGFAVDHIDRAYVGDVSSPG